MRVSVNKADPGYANFKGYRRHEVYLDGERVKYAVTADEELGEVITHKRDADGNVVVENHDVVLLTLRGRVEIRTVPK